MPNQHRSNPISFRPTEADRVFLLQHAMITGRTVNDVLREALRAYFATIDTCPETSDGQHCGHFPADGNCCACGAPGTPED